MFLFCYCSKKHLWTFSSKYQPASASATISFSEHSWDNLFSNAQILAQGAEKQLRKAKAVRSGGGKRYVNKHWDFLDVAVTLGFLRACQQTFNFSVAMHGHDHIKMVTKVRGHVKNFYPQHRSLCQITKVIFYNFPPLWYQINFSAC